MEKVLKIVPDGNISIIIPSGIVTDEGGKQLREELFQGNIRIMYEFENTMGIFQDVHRSYKFVLLVADKGKRESDSFNAAFYLHDIHSLSGRAEQEKFLKMPLQLIQVCAPESLSIPELRNQGSLQVFSKLYSAHPLLGDDKQKQWKVSLITELHRTNDSDLFKSDVKGWPLIEGKNFHQFILNYEKPSYFVEPSQGLSRTGTRKEYREINKEIHDAVRLAFRDTASSTNVRATIACLLPPKSFCPNTAVLVHPILRGSLLLGKKYSSIISYLGGILNSFVFDFLIKSRITMHLNFFYVYQTPVPADLDNQLAQRIIELSVLLSSCDNRFHDFTATLALDPRRLSMKDRIEMTAELNALIAKHYGLSKDDFQEVLDSFNGFKDDEQILKMKGEIQWSDELIRKFNGEVRKRVMTCFDNL